MQLSLGMSMRQELKLDHALPSYGFNSMVGLSEEQMEELADEMVELAESGMFSQKKKNTARLGNLFDSSLFANSAGAIAERPVEGQPAYSIDEDFAVRGNVADVRNRIERRLSRLKRDTPARTQDIFSKRFLGVFDWITENRKKAVGFTVEQQKEFIAEPMNPLRLKDLKQQDIATVLGCHVTTVSRLIHNLLIEFPDTITRELSLLVPGPSITPLKTRYILGILSRNTKYFDNISGWKISHEGIAQIFRDTYGVDIARRTISKHMAWVDANITKRKLSSSSEIIEEQSGSEDDDYDLE